MVWKNEIPACRYGAQLELARNEGLKKGFFSSLVNSLLYFIIFATYALAFWSVSNFYKYCSYQCAVLCLGMALSCYLTVSLQLVMLSLCSYLSCWGAILLAQFCQSWRPLPPPWVLLLWSLNSLKGYNYSLVYYWYLVPCHVIETRD